MGHERELGTGTILNQVVRDILFKKTVRKKSCSCL